MSEYQYYEFRTVNRILTRAEQAEVNTWSSRSNVTPTSAIFIYNYGDFKQNPERCLLGYFEMMLYLANFGCKRLMFRFPAALVDLKALQAYTWEDDLCTIKIYQSEQYVVVDINETMEEGYDGWLEGEGILETLGPLWTDITQGNYACLYLIRAQFIARYQTFLDINEGALDDDPISITEAPIPFGLQQTSAALSAFLSFWDIEDDIVAAAIPKSAALKEAPPVDLEKQLQKLSTTEKDGFLVSLLREEPHVRAALVKRLLELGGTA